MSPSKNEYTRLILPDVMNSKALAERLGVTHRHVVHLLRRGRLPGKKIGSRWYILRTDLLNTLRSSNAKEGVA